jgi:NtrC-family two-component system sensor histidine kinase KinB
MSQSYVFLNPEKNAITREKENGQFRTPLELMYHVSRELASALDLQTLLERILFLSIEHVQAVNGSIIVLDDQGRPVDSAIVIAGEVHQSNTTQLAITFEHGLSGWVARNLQAVRIPDTSRDERWMHRPDDDENRTGAKSVISTPIQMREKLIGVVTLVHPTPGFFTDDHLALVKAIADQAGVAVLNARLYAESQQRARIMTALAESAAVITASLNLEEVLQGILEQITQALRVELVSLALIDFTTQELEFHASTGEDSQDLVGKRLKLGEGVAGWVAQHGIGTVVDDAYSDDRFQPAFDRMLDFKTHGLACAPIRSEGQVIGVLEAINPLDGRFNPDALKVLSGIGSLAGTAIRHAQLFQQLEAAHQRYRELFEDSIDPILITDWNGHIQEANRQAELNAGFENKELRQIAIQQLKVVDQEHVGEHFEKLSGGETVSYETVLHTRDGREIPVQVYVRQVLIDGSSQLQWILRDITERKNLDNLREDLISMIYHDLRSPLANVVSSLDVVASVLSRNGSSELEPLVNIATRSTERIQRLTNSLLDINRLEGGQPVGERRPVKPYALANDAYDAVAPVVKNKKLEVVVDVSPDLPAVSVDEDMIRRVLINLLENAIKFTPPGSTIHVGSTQEGDFIQMWVKDNGPGIPASEHARIFDKFTRLHSKNGPKGLGLGLAFCRLAVIGHGGQIWLDSEAGKGASFHFSIPIATNEQENANPVEMAE